MSYLALARKYRPQMLSEVIGHERVTRSLALSLDAHKRHHCYLFSGTRGVGKTTLARILAKAINCQQGMSGSPCNQCEHCTEITAGSFIDVIEIDAASRTKVEDTRELLEQVRYLPTKGICKVYIIDEVHMLSNHSFNALLKTLEEPPEHVCFILATTHPHKLPPTILSRCLHFELASLGIDVISTQLAHVLDVEQINYQPEALNSIATQARGSMRDALSLLDRALSVTQFDTQEKALLRTEDVRDVLGVGSVTHIWQLLGFLFAADAKGLLTCYHDMQQRNYESVWLLDGLLTLLQQCALYKHVGKLDWIDVPEDCAAQLASVSAEQIQLFYQITLHAKRDLPYMPDETQGMEMILLRLVAFYPDAVATHADTQTQQQHTKNIQTAANEPAQQTQTDDSTANAKKKA